MRRESFMVMCKAFIPKEAIMLGMTNAYHTIQTTHTVRVDLYGGKLEEVKELFE